MTNREELKRKVEEAQFDTQLIGDAQGYGMKTMLCQHCENHAKGRGCIYTSPIIQYCVDGLKKWLDKENDDGDK